MRYLVLGCNGMAGHMISLYLRDKGYDVTGFARSKSKFIDTIIGDALDKDILSKVVLNEKWDNIVNCIGLLNIYAEEHKAEAVYLNSFLPHFLAELTDGTEKRIIHISTDCVFSGKRGGYSESDFPDGESFYDRSKALGELNNKKDLTIRTSIVGPDMKRGGIGLVNWFMQQNGKVNGYKNAMWTGQTTLQLAKTIENSSKHHVHGLFNLVPREKISKYDLLMLFNRYLRTVKIEIIPEESYKIDKSLIRTNFEMFDYSIPDYEEQMAELGDWLNNHKDLYPHYY
jgi:dTDP-4-dehydrorhamnose reductase